MTSPSNVRQEMRADDQRDDHHPTAKNCHCGIASRVSLRGIVAHHSGEHDYATQKQGYDEDCASDDKSTHLLSPEDRFED